MSALRKNVASQVVTFALVNATTGAALTGATVTTKATLDGTQSAGAGTVTELGSGQYKYVPTQGETNGATLGLLFTATNAVPVNLHAFITASDPTDAVRMGLTALPNAAAEASGGLATLSAAQASNGTINANVHRWLTGTPNALQSGRVDSYLGAVAAGVIAAASFAVNALDAVWSTATRVLTAGTNIVLAKGTGVTGFTDLDASGVRGAVGLASANLDTQLAALASYIDTEVAALVAAAYTRTGTAQAGASGSITLDSGASAVDDFYKNQIVVIASGTGAGQARFISAYAGSTKVATVATWATTPNNTSVFYIVPFGAIPGATAPTAAEIRQEIDNNSTQLAALATAVDAVPTNAELATALAAADDAVLAAIAALSIPTANQNADALLDRASAIETALTVRGSLRLIAAACAGKASGLAGTTATYRNAVADSKDRIVATVDADGNRSAVTTDVS